MRSLIRSTRGYAQRVLRPFNMAILLVAAAIGSGLVIGQSVDVNAPPAEAVKTAQAPVTRVLQNSNWLSEKSWKRRKLKKARSNKSYLGAGQGFGASSNNARRRKNSTGPSHGNYRTVCVRLCDGYYFPVSFSTSKDRFKKDAQACQSRCSGGARLFYYNNYDGSPDTMKDLRGRTYRSLKTAYLYRTNYKPSCQCRAAPWSDKAKERHALYQTKKWQTKARRLARKEHRKGLRIARKSAGKARIIASSRRENQSRRSQNQSVAATALTRTSTPFQSSSRMSLGGRISSVTPKARVRPKPRVTSRRKKRWRKKVLFGVGSES